MNFTSMDTLRFRICWGEDCGIVGGDGFSTLPGPAYGDVYGGGLPPDAIIPTEQSTVVGEGVTVTAPAE